MDPVSWVFYIATNYIWNAVSWVSQTIFARFSNDSDERIPDHTPGNRTLPNSIHVHPTPPIWSYLVIGFILIVVMDRLVLLQHHYSMFEGQKEFAVAILTKVCTDDTRYRGAEYNERCMEAYRTKNAGKLSHAFEQTIAGTHLCIWWDCSTVAYNALTTMPQVSALTFVAVLAVIMCGNRMAPPQQTIAFIPSRANYPPFEHPPTPTRENSQKKL